MEEGSQQWVPCGEVYISHKGFHRGQAALAGFLSPCFYAHFGLMQQKRVSETPKSVFFYHAKKSNCAKWEMEKHWLSKL